MIKLKITKFEPNEQYKEQLEAYEKAAYENRFNMRDGAIIRNVSFPEPNNVATILEVQITEEQWEAIRKATLERF